MNHRGSCLGGPAHCTTRGGSMGIVPSFCCHLLGEAEMALGRFQVRAVIGSSWVCFAYGERLSDRRRLFPCAVETSTSPHGGDGGNRTRVQHIFTFASVAFRLPRSFALRADESPWCTNWPECTTRRGLWCRSVRLSCGRHCGSRRWWGFSFLNFQRCCVAVDWRINVSQWVLIWGNGSEGLTHHLPQRRSASGAPPPPGPRLHRTTDPLGYGPRHPGHCLIR